MTRDHQHRFVADLIDSVHQSFVQLSEQGKIPAEWDGFELRQWLADRFGSNVYSMGKYRRNQYENTLATVPGLI